MTKTNCITVRFDDTTRILLERAGLISTHTGRVVKSTGKNLAEYVRYCVKKELLDNGYGGMSSAELKERYWNAVRIERQRLLNDANERHSKMIQEAVVKQMEARSLLESDMIIKQEKNN